MNSGPGLSLFTRQRYEALVGVNGTRRFVRSIYISTLKALVQEPDGKQSEVVAQRILADENVLLRQFRFAVPPHRRIGLDGMGQRVRTCNRGQGLRAAQRQIRIADRGGGDESRREPGDGCS